VGHNRGVKSLSCYENTLLSGGFDCDGRTWDLLTKESVAVLKGHRHPLTAGIVHFITFHAAAQMRWRQLYVRIVNL
jgi:hypothetical protein